MSKIDSATQAVEDLGELADAIKKNFSWVKPTIMSILLMLGGGTVLENKGTIDYTPIGQGDDWVWEDGEDYSPYYGCTDSIAMNYDLYADTDDGLCEYDHPDHEGLTCGDSHSDQTHEEWDAGNQEEEEEPEEEEEVVEEEEPETCDPIFYSAVVGYGDPNNTTVETTFDIDCSNMGITERVQVQFLAWTNGTNWSNSDGPFNWTQGYYNITEEEWDEHTLILGNFTEGNYDLYLYVILEEGGVAVNREWMNVPIKKQEEGE